jgi:hypothetical protein
MLSVTVPVLRNRLGRPLSLLILLPLLLVVYTLFVTAFAAALQARDVSDAAADLALVVAEQPLTPGLADYVTGLLDDGRVPTVYIGGDAAVELTNALRARRLTDQQVTAPPISSVAGLIDAARRSGARSALVVAAPTQQLRVLKQVRDSGLTAFSAPPAAANLSPGELLTAALNYWSALLISR